MKIPLVILAICSVFAGLVPFGKFITSDGVPFSTHMDTTFSIVPVALALGAILFAAYLYKKENVKPARIAASLGSLYQAVYKKFYIDEVYLFITKKVVFNLIGKPAAWIDKNIVDGFMNLMASITARISGLIKGLQSGRVQSYAFYFFAGIIGMAALFIYLWK